MQSDMATFLSTAELVHCYTHKEPDWTDPKPDPDPHPQLFISLSAFVTR